MSRFSATLISAGIIFCSVPTVQAQMRNNIKMPEGITMKTIEADGYKVSFQIIERTAFKQYMDAKGRKSRKMKPGSTHYIKVDTSDPKDKKVTQSVVKLKVISPDGNLKQKRAFPINDSFGTEFSMAPKGSHQVMILFKAHGKKYKGGFRHTIQ